jgi:formate hydrogenlyase subunit 3/multisubunit Na+/H+ antiporter MnhD subunit
MFHAIINTLQIIIIIIIIIIMLIIIIIIISYNRFCFTFYKELP